MKTQVELIKIVNKFNEMFEVGETVSVIDPETKCYSNDIIEYAPIINGQKILVFLKGRGRTNIKRVYKKFD